MNHEVYRENNTHSHVVSVGYTKILEFFMNHQVFHDIEFFINPQVYGIQIRIPTKNCGEGQTEGATCALRCSGGSFSVRSTWTMASD